MIQYLLPSFDSFPISVHEFIPECSIQKTIVFAPAVAVPQKFYFHLATYLSEKGYHVITFDYRGIGSSKPKKITRLKKDGFLSWALDFKTVSLHVKNKYSHHALYMIGHSYGGNTIGLSDVYQYYDKQLFVASQFGVFNNFSATMRFLITLNFRYIIPITTFLLGYYPAGWFGLGNSLPSQAAKDWGIFLLHPDSMLYFAKQNNTTHHTRIHTPMLLISIEDDTYAPTKSVEALTQNVYTNAMSEQLHLLPKNYGLSQIGHFDFFRQKNKDILWPIVTNWFEKQHKTP